MVDPVGIDVVVVYFSAGHNEKEGKKWERTDFFRKEACFGKNFLRKDFSSEDVTGNSWRWGKREILTEEALGTFRKRISSEAIFRKGRLKKPAKLTGDNSSETIHSGRVFLRKDIRARSKESTEKAEGREKFPKRKDLFIADMRKAKRLEIGKDASEGSFGNSCHYILFILLLLTTKQRVGDNCGTPWIGARMVFRKMPQQLGLSRCFESLLPKFPSEDIFRTYRRLAMVAFGGIAPSIFGRLLRKTLYGSTGVIPAQQCASHEPYKNPTTARKEG